MILSAMIAGIMRSRIDARGELGRHSVGGSNELCRADLSVALKVRASAVQHIGKIIIAFL